MKNRTLWLLLVLSLIWTNRVSAQSTHSDRPKVALVMGGGGAKGAAAIGALKYVDQAGIPIDYVVGTSAGAIIGSLYAVGYTAQEIDSIYRCQDWHKIFSDINPNHIKHGRLHDFIPGLLGGRRFTETLDQMLQHRDCPFDSLPIPFRAIAVNMREFSEVCLDRGNLAEAVRASMSVPMAFRPVERDSMILVDGGLLNNLPVDVAYRLGADIVIAIDLTDPKRLDRESLDSIPWSGLGALIAWKFARPDLSKYRENRQAATLLIHPDVKGFKGTSFSPDDTRQLIENGEEAGQEVWEQLLEIAQRCHPE